MIKLTDLLNEQESFTATSKKSGETVVFKTKDARDTAVKAGTHSKIKDKKDGDSKKDTPKVNIFKRDSDRDSKERLKKKSTSNIPDNDYSYHDEPSSKEFTEKSVDVSLAKGADTFNNFLDDNESKFSKKDFKELKRQTGSIKSLESELADAERKGDKETILDLESDISFAKFNIKNQIGDMADEYAKDTKKDKKSEPKSEPSKFDIDDVQDFTDVDDLIDKNKSKLSKQQIDKLTQLSADWEDAEGDMQAGGSDDDYQETVSFIRADVEDILSSKEDEPKRDDNTDAQIDDVQNNIGDLDGDEIRDYAESDIFPYLKGRDLEIAKSLVDDIEDSGSDFVRSADLRKDLKDLFDKKMTLDSPKEEPKSEPSKPRPGNPQVNKSVREKAQDLGITPQKLGKEEYESKMSKAAVEALTDANFHSEARKLISILEDNPEFAKNPNKDPNKPKDMFSPEYDEWRKNSVFSSEFYDSAEGTDEIAHMASNEAGWEGETAVDAIAFDLKMNGSKKLAAKIQSIFNEKNESSTSLRDLLPESVINEGTRSQVGVIGRNGKIVSAYVHYDGYPSNMKPGLKKHMKSDKDVLKLIKMGGARGIFDDKEIEYYKSGKPMKGDSKDVESYIKNADRNEGAEFVYLYNMKDKKWYYADTYKDTKLKKLF